MAAHDGKKDAHSASRFEEGSKNRRITKHHNAMKTLLIILLSIITLSANAQNGQPQEAPQLEFALQLKVTLGEVFSINNTQHGRRTVIPITGGTFEGPALKGTILNGGADYQLASADGRTELEAIYCIKTDDGIYIHVRNRGIISNGKDADGKPSFYFRAAPQFEAPADSKYGWLNNALFVCTPTFTSDFKGIVLNVWRVK
jgi:hypothetical protein